MRYCAHGGKVRVHYYFLWFLSEANIFIEMILYIMFLMFLNNRIHMKNYGKTKHCCAFTIHENNWICHEKFRLYVSRDTFERIIKFKLKSISFCVNYKRIKKNIYIYINWFMVIGIVWMKLKLHYVINEMIRQNWKEK